MYKGTFCIFNRTAEVAQFVEDQARNRNVVDSSPTVGNYFLILYK